MHQIKEQANIYLQQENMLPFAILFDQCLHAEEMTVILIMTTRVHIERLKLGNACGGLKSS